MSGRSACTGTKFAIRAHLEAIPDRSSIDRAHRVSSRRDARSETDYNKCTFEHARSPVWCRSGFLPDLLGQELREVRLGGEGGLVPGTEDARGLDGRTAIIDLGLVA